MKWFREAKFGLFIHWGLYSIPAGEWKGQMIPTRGETIMRDARIPINEYAKLASQFNPHQFDPEYWAKFAEEAGAKYIVMTAKDRDGFAMYKSGVNSYNVFDATPFHRDPLKELAAACARHNIKLCLYYSLAEDWHDPNGAGNDWDYGPEHKKSFDAYLRGKAEPQLKELLTGYGPLGAVWFGQPGTMNEGQTNRIVNLVRSLQPAALIGGRLGTTSDYLSRNDDSIPAAVLNGDWEVAATLNHTGGFKKFDNNWKSIDEVIFELVDTVSKGGNYALQVGPTADGIIPEPFPATLERVGAWLKTNGEAIYGAGPSTLGLGGTSGGQFIKWRCTTKPGKLFITLFQWPDKPLELEVGNNKIASAFLQADEKKQPLELTQVSGRATVKLPKDPPLESEVPEKMNPALLIAASHAHVRSVLVLEIQKP